MCLATKVDKQRLGAKQPVGVMQEFRAAADRPPSLRVLVGLRKCAEMAWGRKLPHTDAVIAERVIDACIGKAASGIEQPIVVDHNTGSGTKRPKPIHPALKTDRLNKTGWPGFNVERRGRRVEVVEIRLYTEDERATAALPVIAGIPTERESTLGVFKRDAGRWRADCLIGDFASLLPIA